MYSQFLVSLCIDAYRLYGGHGVLNFCDDLSLSSMVLYSQYTDTLICYYTTVLPRLSIVDLSEQLKWHQKQLQAGNRCTIMAVINHTE